MGQRLAGQHVADDRAVALLVVDHGEQRGPRSPARVEQVVEGRERRRLLFGRVQWTVDHGPQDTHVVKGCPRSMVLSALRRQISRGAG